MTLSIGIVDLSGDPRVTKDGLNKIAYALAKQVAEDYCGWWEATPIEIGVFDSVTAIPAGWSPFRLIKTLEEADALAYHTEVGGVPQLYCGTDVIFDNGGTLLSGSNSISAAMSHEVLETLADPYIDWWTDMNATHELALEVADPVEGDCYEIDGVSVSNFVGPRYFRSGPGPYDKMGTLKRPFSMSHGGYQVLRTGGPNGKATEVFGEGMPEWKREQKHAHSRRVRKHREKHGV